MIRNGAEIKAQIQASGFGLRFSVFWRMTTMKKQVNLAFEWREPAKQMPGYLSQKRGNIRSKDVHQFVLLFQRRSLGASPSVGCLRIWRNGQNNDVQMYDKCGIDIAVSIVRSYLK